jgi:hypothetical protein
VFNTVNLHLYHYAGNNPVKYTDPDGKDVYNCFGEDIYVRNEDGKLFLVSNGEGFRLPDPLRGFFAIKFALHKKIRDKRIKVEIMQKIITNNI